MQENLFWSQNYLDYEGNLSDPEISIKKRGSILLPKIQAPATIESKANSPHDDPD